MKTQKNLMMIALLTLAGGASAHAGVANMAGTWNGAGAVFSLEGDNQGEYQVQLVDLLQGDGSVASTVTVTIPNVPVKQFNQVIRDTPKGFSMTSDQGSGGAVCVGDGLCEGYFGDPNGNGMAITIVMDGPDAFRSLKTELQNFKAVRLYREKYVRAQSN